MHRRELLQVAGAALLGSLSWRLWAAPSGGSNGRFILIFLRGGYDALSALSPYSEPYYYEARPNIAIPPPSEIGPGAVLALDERWGLHPAMQDSVLPLYEAKEVAFIPFAGSAFISRSHFQAQDWVEFGQPAGPNPDPGSGFLNRLLERLNRSQPQSSAISFTRALPPVMRGHARVANSPIIMPKGRTVVDQHEESILAMYRNHPLEDYVHDGIGLRRQISIELREEMQSADRGAPQAKGFAREAGRIGRLMREHPRYRIGFIELGGWDTHAGQGNAQGNLAYQLHGLGEGLRILADGLGQTWPRTVVAVISEFGRTFRENGSRGTDHGHGTMIWVLGGGIAGGRILGDQARLRPEDLHEDRDLPVLNEYRSVLGGICRNLFAMNKDDMDYVFPKSPAFGASFF